MSTLTSYKQLQVVTPDPTGNGGLALNNNFMTLADSIGPCNYTATADPTTSDNQSTGYYAGSRWFNTSTNDEFVCISSTMSTAVWEKTTGGNSAPTLQQVTDAGNTTTDDISVANVFMASGDTLSVDIMNDAGSGSITVGTATVFSGNSWSIDSSGNGTFNNLNATAANVDQINSYSSGSISVLTQLVIDSTILAASNNWSIDSGGDGTFGTILVGSSTTLSTSGLGTYEIYTPGSILTIAGGNWNVDTEGDGTFNNLQLNAGQIISVTGTVTIGTNVTIDPSGTGNFASAINTGAIFITNGMTILASIDSSGNGTFANLQSTSQTLPTIDSTVSGTTAGQVGYDPSTSKAYVWDGSAWNALW